MPVELMDPERCLLQEAANRSTTQRSRLYDVIMGEYVRRRPTVGALAKRLGWSKQK